MHNVRSYLFLSPTNMSFAQVENFWFHKLNSGERVQIS